MWTIQKVKRKNLNVEKYTQAIDEALNYRVYAEVWYLDLLTKNQWECWIYGDYEVVMPIPLQYKFGIKFVLQPIYCQQLGVFYKQEISDELFQTFEKKLHQYRVRAYHFNEENTERYHPKGEKKVNYLLDLNLPYEQIFENYSKGRRKDIRKSERLGVQVRSTQDLKNHKELFQQYYAHLEKYGKKKFKGNYSNTLIKKGALKIFDLFDKENNLLASQMFLISKRRKICLGFVRNKHIEQHNASAFAKDHLIRVLAGQNDYIDFEGSMHPTIAKFMEGFGPMKKHYTYYSNFSSIKDFF